MHLAANALKFLAVTVAVIVITQGCGLKAGQNAEHSKDHPNPYQTTDEFDVQKTSLTCSDSSRCPEALGVILTVQTSREDRGYYVIVRTSVNRCTGALYDSTKILTAAHCTRAMNAGSKTYFRTVRTAGKPSRVFEVKRVLKKVFVENQLGLDYAALELVSPADGYDYVRPPGVIPGDLNEMTALVVNQIGESGRALTLDAVDCEHEDKFSLLPFHVSTFPSVFGTQKCKLVSGNSGGPIFQKTNLTEVMGVLSRSTEASDSNVEIARLLRLLGNRGTVSARSNLATFTNAGCLDLPGWPAPSPKCMTVDEDLVSRHNAKAASEVIREELIEKLQEWFRSPEARPRVGSAVVKMGPLAVTLKEWFPADRTQGDFVGFMPVPVCVESGEVKDARSVPFAMPLWAMNIKLGESVRLRTTPFKYKGTFDISGEVSGEFIFKYRFPFDPQFDFPSDRRAKYAAGVRSKLESCKGNEDAKLIEELRTSDLEKLGSR
jgi:hypothetical protein